MPTLINELPALFERYVAAQTITPTTEAAILSDTPSAVVVPASVLKSEGWTPNHHSAQRYRTLSALSAISKTSQFTARKLSELILPRAVERTRRSNVKDARCISVLHVGDFGFLNVRELLNYKPKYAGQACEPGDVLFSKINPRIPRVLVVPDFGMPFTCSSEFEVLRPQRDVSPFTLALLLLSEFAQSQILSLTSGTSSSHNRIKAAQLLDIILPVPKTGTKSAKTLAALSAKFETAQVKLHHSAYESHQYLSECDKLLSAATP